MQAHDKSKWKMGAKGNAVQNILFGNLKNGGVDICCSYLLHKDIVQIVLNLNGFKRTVQ